jgi:hypothetical protein
MLIKISLHSMMLAIGRLSLVVPDAPTPWPARIIGARLDHAVPAYEAGELTRADWPLRLLERMWNENMVFYSTVPQLNRRNSLSSTLHREEARDPTISMYRNKSLPCYLE